MENNFWNSKVLKPPIVNSFKCKSPAIDLNNVISILDEAIDTFVIPNTLRIESSIMRRVIYRLKLQFRLDKGFKLFESTNRNLNSLFTFNITKDLTYLLDEVPKKYDKDFYLPSKQMLQYVLVRLQGYSQVSSRVVESAFKAAIFMKGRVRLGHQWEIATVLFAILSRIWLICKHFTTKCCLLYNELLLLLDKLEITGTKWLPDNYEFPKDLLDWLNCDCLFEKPEVILQLPLELPIFSLLDDDEDDVQYNSRYQQNKNKTIVITDSTDDEDENDDGNVKFVCSFNKSYIKLDKSKVKQLEAQPEYGTKNKKRYKKYGIATTRSFDTDVQIIEPIENNIKSNYNSLNISGFAPLVINEDVIELDDSVIDDDEVANEEKAKELERELLDDIGEPIIREKPANAKVSDQSESSDDDNINVIIDSTKINLRTAAKLQGRRKRKQIENDKNNSKQIQEKNNKEVNNKNNKQKDDKKTYKKKNKKIKTHIVVQGKTFSLSTVAKLEKFLDDQCKHRETKGPAYLSGHLDDNDWTYLTYEIKYIIAMAMNSEINEQIYMEKARILLQQLLNFDVNDPDDYLGNPVVLNKIDNKKHLPMTLVGKKYLIRTLDSKKDLQLFLEKESSVRKMLPEICVFDDLDADDWNDLCYELKYLILMATHKPLKSKFYIKQAKTILTKSLCNNDVIDSYNTVDSDDDSADSDVEQLRQQCKEEFDELYSCVSEGQKVGKLFDYVDSLDSDILYPNQFKPSKKWLRKKAKETFLNQRSAFSENNELNDSSIEQPKTEIQKLTKKQRKMLRKQEAMNNSNINMCIKGSNNTETYNCKKVSSSTQTTSDLFDNVKESCSSPIYPTSRYKKSEILENSNVQNATKKKTKKRKRKIAFDTQQQQKKMKYSNY